MMQIIRRVASWLRQHATLSRWALRLIPDIPITLSLNGFGRMRVKLRTHRALWLRDPLTFENVPLTALRHLVAPGDTVFDLGANLGLYARYMVCSCGAGEVVAFEPSASNREQFMKNANLGAIADRTQLLPFAIANFDGQAEFQIDDFQSTSGALDVVQNGKPSLARANLGLPPKTESVECRTLDTLIAQGIVPIPTTMKVDIEGAEDIALEGARNLLQAHKPNLLIELHGADVAKRVLRFVLALGYSCRGSGTLDGLKGGLGPVSEQSLADIRGLYDLHFLVASVDPTRLAALDRAFPPAAVALPTGL